MKPTLQKAPVTFYPESHLYIHNETGAQLSGITPLLHEKLFPNQYAAISPAVLAAAAERGTAVHALCQFEDEMHRPCSCPDAPDYEAAAHTYSVLRNATGLQPLANEYLVTDGRQYASQIDCVWYNPKDGSIILVDIKTTSQLYTDSVTWQLCIYRYLFELQNPDLHVSAIMCAYLPFSSGEFQCTRAELLPLLNMYDDIAVADLLYGGTDQPKEEEKTATVQSKEEAVTKAPALIGDRYVERYIAAVQQLKELEAEKAAILEALQSAMEAHGIRTWDAQRIRATYTAESTAKTFDTKAFQKDHPDLYLQYQKETRRKPRLTVTIRDTEA